MQATKLLQLKKATMHDIEVVFDVCWLLTPSQINKLVSSYSTADYENPISPEILRAVATRVTAGGAFAQLRSDLTRAQTSRIICCYRPSWKRPARSRCRCRGPSRAFGPIHRPC